MDCQVPRSPHSKLFKVPWKSVTVKGKTSSCSTVPIAFVANEYGRDSVFFFFSTLADLVVSVVCCKLRVCANADQVIQLIRSESIGES